MSSLTPNAACPECRWTIRRSWPGRSSKESRSTARRPRGSSASCSPSTWYELREKQGIEEDRKRRNLQRAREALARESGPTPLVRRPAGEAEEQQLRQRVQAGWRSGKPSLKGEAEAAVGKAVPLARWLYGSHGADRENDRWTYMRHYLRALAIAFGDSPPGEERLIEEVLREEKIYLAKLQRQAEQAAKARRPVAQLEALRAWARRQPMNPADDFEPGIAYYDPNIAASMADWVDKDVEEVSQDGYVTTISYTRGADLSFPAKSLDFDGKYQSSIVELFVRRHKASRRLVPFVIYLRSVDLYRELPEIDELSGKDRVLMALPYMLTQAVGAFYSQDVGWAAMTKLLKVIQLLALRRALPIAAPAAAGTAATAFSLGARSVVLGRAAVAEVTFAVRTYGFTTYAATYVGRSAYTYYLTHAVAVNTGVVIGADITLAIVGQDMGPISPGDVLTMVGQADDAARAGVKTWKAIQGEVKTADKATGKAVLRVSSVDSITDDVANAEFDLGRKVKGEAKGASRSARGVADPATKSKATKGPAVEPKKPAPPVIPADQVAKSTGKVKLAPDPRKLAPVNELEEAMKKVATGLDRLGAKYSAKAIERIKSISADAIRESGIRPSDLANLANSLSRAGATTRRFVNDFHDVPGFERVLLGWAKRHYWNSKLKKPAWIATKAFYTGSSYVMKYSTRRLDPRFVRFEWPVSINDTKWGEEVFARYVDIVVSGGNTVKPGQQIQIELKSWTEFVLRMKTSFSPGKSTSYPGTVGYQLLRDTALFDPNNIRWVFDGSKVSKDRVIAAFERIIADDDFLRAQWGGKEKDGRPLPLDPAKIRELLDKVIEVF